MKRVGDKHRLPEKEHTVCYSRRKVLVTQLCPTLWDPVDCSLPDSSVHGILQTRILEWVANPLSRWSSWPKDQTQISPTVGRFFTIWATKVGPKKEKSSSNFIIQDYLWNSTGIIKSLTTLRSDQISHSIVSDSLWPHESQHARPPCPSPTPGVHSDSRPSSQWCHPAISSSVVPFSSCPQSLPASEFFPKQPYYIWRAHILNKTIKEITL